MRRSLVPAIALLVLLSSGAPAYAYLDPATGSLMLQVLLGGIAGLLLTLKLFWRRISGFLGSKRPEAEEPEE